MPACNLPPNVLDCVLYLREICRSLFEIASLISCIINLVLDWDIHLAQFASVLHRLKGPGDRQLEHAWADWPAWPNWLGLVGMIRPAGVL